MNKFILKCLKIVSIVNLHNKQNVLTSSKINFDFEIVYSIQTLSSINQPRVLVL